MATEAALALKNGTIVEAEVKDIAAMLFFIPLAICLFSIALAVKYPVFADAIAALGLE